MNTPARSPGEPPVLSIITAVWSQSAGRGRAVLDLAASLRRTVTVPYELVVVENGVAAPAELSDFRRVSLSENRGVAKAWNAGAEVSTAPYLAFANDDVVLGWGCMNTLVEILDADDRIGVAGPRGARWDAPAGRHVAYVEGDGILPVDVVSGFLFVTRRESWTDVGGFDERFTPCSYEEIDYCFAVRAGGWRCVAVSGLSFDHDWGVSRWRPYRRVRFEGRSESVRSINRRNRRLFMEKWG